MGKSSRRKFTAEFNSKVCTDALREQQTIEALAMKYDLHSNKLIRRPAEKKEFLTNPTAVFEKERKGPCR